MTPHFALREFIPWYIMIENVPADVVAALNKLVVELLEPCRVYLNTPLRVTSGWRPAVHNTAVGGVRASDHTVGRAADLQGLGSAAEIADGAYRAFHYFRERPDLPYGQIILEDHRQALDNNNKVWVHVAYLSPKHPGTNDPNRILLSPRPGEYEQWRNT